MFTSLDVHFRRPIVGVTRECLAKMLERIAKLHALVAFSPFGEVLARETLFPSQHSEFPATSFEALAILAIEQIHGNFFGFDFVSLTL